MVPPSSSEATFVTASDSIESCPLPLGTFCLASYGNRSPFVNTTKTLLSKIFLLTSLVKWSSFSLLKYRHFKKGGMSTRREKRNGSASNHRHICTEEGKLWQKLIGRLCGRRRTGGLAGLAGSSCCWRSQGYCRVPQRLRLGQSSPRHYRRDGGPSALSSGCSSSPRY